MYKYLLCWRYLRTRKIALASAISVMLGVATMIVVNSVMAGFAEKMRSRLKGVLSDVTIEAMSFDGFGDSEEVMALARKVAGDKIEAMSPTLETIGIMTILTPGGQKIDRDVHIIGVLPEDRAKTGDFAEYLVDQQGKKIPPSLEVPDELRLASSPAGDMLKDTDPKSPFYKYYREQAFKDVPADGTIVGYALATHHVPGDKDYFLAPVGSKVIVTLPSAENVPTAKQDEFTVVGYSKSGMSEYDATQVFIKLDRLQLLRLGGERRVSHIQIKAKPGVDLDDLAKTLQLSLSKIWPLHFRVTTWEQKQGTLLAAVALEQGILNILLFLIIAVAGFGILAIFSMIVVEKTRDIGILKALGASTGGIRSIFLGYGLTLGLVGSGFGLAFGLAFVAKINEIEKWLSRVTGRKVFDDAIYYFDSIPTRVDPFTVAWIVTGALLIAVAASVIPAQRAAKLNPVKALRFE